MAASAHHAISNKGGKIYGIFRYTCMYKQPILTKYWNYNSFVQILYSTLRYVFLVARCNIIRASWGSSKNKRLSCRKKYIEEFETSFLWLHAVFLM